VYVTDLFLKKGREKAVQNRHPWIFSGAVDRVKGDAADGSMVTVRDAHGQFLAYGYLNARSQIVVRLLSWDQNEPIDDAFWQRCIARAIARRQRLVDDDLTTAYRLVYAESDHLPGLVVDRYGEFLVIQCLTLGIAQRRDMIVQILANMLSPRGIYERSDVDVRKLEGLDQACGVVYGDEPPSEIEIVENGHRFLVDLKNGQKTGFYLDQRENRQALARFAQGSTLLNVFSYSGAFSVYAASAGAGPIVNLDSSKDALALAKRNMRLNGLPGTQDEYQVGSAFDLLREYRDRGRSFDLIVLDPPKFAPTRRHAKRAARAYKDINLLAFKLLRPEGVVCTFSCSAGIDADLFQKIVFGASVDAKRDAQIIRRLAQGPDHPVLLSFPESAYLKGLICRVLD
jgi:23S rRNA (cytosine1962-C5)-methyltransferase